jgi:hypothetical protein
MFGVSSWLELATLVIGHGRHPFALLSAEVIGKLCSTEQTKENGGEVGSHELHGSIPQPLKDQNAIEHGLVMFQGLREVGKV